MSEPAPIPAATLVLFRERDDGDPELLVVERSGGMAFAAGALVFPGGRIDAADRALAADAADKDDAAARVAAIRETLEESGLAIGIVPAPGAAEAAALRAALADGAAFDALLAAEGRSLDLDALMLFARWCPNHRQARNFDTRFYIARVPDDAHEPTVDETENVRLFWASAAEVLAMSDRGEAHVIFPTRCNLERLAGFASFEDARAQAAATAVRLIRPWIEERDGVAHICIPEGQGYPITAQPLAEVCRG